MTMEQPPTEAAPLEALLSEEQIRALELKEQQEKKEKQHLEDFFEGMLGQKVAVEDIQHVVEHGVMTCLVTYEEDGRIVKRRWVIRPEG